MKRFKLIIEYDGTNYCGWQIQKNDRSVQGEIEKAIFSMTAQKAVLKASGRTDAKVHAQNQVAHFDIETDITKIDFFNGLNSLTSDDIVIKDVLIEDETFHSRFLVLKKTYRYTIINQKLPIAIKRNYAWHVKKRLNLNAMKNASKLIVGYHNFASFEKTGSLPFNTERKIFKVELKTIKNYIYFDITGSGFLRGMVRNLVGAFVDVGLNKISVDDFSEILFSKDRTKNKSCAPPQGLTLLNVEYKKERKQCYPFCKKEEV